MQTGIGKWATEQNGMWEGGKHKVSTRKELCEFLNTLAHKIGIDKTEQNPGGYLATEESIG